MDDDSSRKVDEPVEQTTADKDGNEGNGETTSIDEQPDAAPLFVANIEIERHSPQQQSACQNRDRYDKWTLLLAFFALLVAGVAAYFAFMESDASREQVKAARETANNAQRAWISVVGAKIVGNIKTGEPMVISVRYQNTGKHVAQKVVHTWASHEFSVTRDDAGIPYIGTHNVPWPMSDPCTAEIQPLQKGPAYPGTPMADIRYLYTLGPFLPQDFRDKKKSYWIVGCFTYETFGDARQSPYCLYWQPYRDLPIEESTFEFCLRWVGTAS
jgi:hypothetical protein